MIALERQLWAAELRRDRAGVDSLIAPEYVYLSNRAQDRTKAEDLDLRFGPHVTLEAYELHSPRTVRVAADVIALHYLADQRIREDSVRICPHTGTSETWARRGGQWRLTTRTEYLLGAARPPACAGAPAK